MLPLPLLRSIIKFDSADVEVTLAENLTTLYTEVRPDGIDGQILGYVWSLYDRAHAVPTIATVRERFELLTTQADPAGPAALQRLDGMVPLPTLLDRAAFRAALDTYQEETLHKVTTSVLIEAATILKTGLTTKAKINGQTQTVTLKGPAAAVQRLQEGVAGLGTLFRGRTSHGEMAADTDAVWRAWEKAKANPGNQFGVLSGIQHIDAVHGGLQRGDLAFVLGFVGHMKSTFCMNWYYKAAVLYKKRVGYVTLESSVEKFRQHLAVLHTQHPKFLDDSIPAVTTTMLRMGMLTPAQEKIFEAALADIKNTADYGPMHYRGIGDDKADITMEDVGAWVRDLCRHDGLDLLVIDYLGLVSPGDSRMRQRGSALSDFSQLNVAIRESKLLAQSADGGKGISILSPFQANREGLKEAEKNGGRYNLRAMSGANESERSADFVYYVYLDDSLRNGKEIACGNLKTRDVPLLTDQFRLYADGDTKLIDDLAPATPVSP